MIAVYLDISQPAVSQMLETARALQRKDQKFSRAVEEIRRLTF
jgi:predicted transcriptional regulator